MIELPYGNGASEADGGLQKNHIVYTRSAFFYVYIGENPTSANATLTKYWAKKRNDDKTVIFIYMLQFHYQSVLNFPFRTADISTTPLNWKKLREILWYTNKVTSKIKRGTFSVKMRKRKCDFFPSVNHIVTGYAMRVLEEHAAIECNSQGVRKQTQIKLIEPSIFLLDNHGVWANLRPASPSTPTPPTQVPDNSVYRCLDR